MAKPRSVKETLRAAHAIIKVKERWTRRQFAEDREGSPVRGTDPSAVKFCALGALQKVDGRFELRAVIKLEDVCKKLFKCCIPTVNDDFGRAAILKAFRVAIKECK